MIVIDVYLKVNPAKRAEYLDFVNDLVAKSRQDLGNIFYDHFESLTEKNTFMIIENWSDEEAVEFHNQTEHLQGFLKNIEQYLLESYMIKVAQTK